jgi:hypothetical protein
MSIPPSPAMRDSSRQAVVKEAFGLFVNQCHFERVNVRDIAAPVMVKPELAGSRRNPAANPNILMLNLARGSLR